MIEQPDGARAFIRDCLTSGVLGHRVDPQTIHDDFDVIVHGGLDSLGFLELVTRLEDRFGHELDLAGVDVEQLTRVRTLADAAEEGAA